MAVKQFPWKPETMQLGIIEFLIELCCVYGNLDLLNRRNVDYKNSGVTHSLISRRI